MRRTIVSVVAVIAAAAVPASAHAQAPHRTTTQATNYLMKRVDSGTGNCGGRQTDRPGTGLYRSFVCYLTEWDANGDDLTAAYQLDTRPRGRWHVRQMR